MIILGAAGLAISAAFCVVASSALRRRLLPDADSDLALLVQILVFTALQTFLILAAGLIGVLSALPLALISVAGLGALIGMGQARLSWTFRKPATLQEWILAGAAGLLALSLVVKVFLLSPYWGDAITYHLPNVAEWVRSKRLVFGFMPDHRVWFPMGFELVETWWVVFLGHDALIEAAGVQMLLLATFAVRVIARALDFDGRLAGVVFAFTPILILHTTTCGNDLGSAALVLSGFALVAARAPRALQAFPLLLGSGMKPTVLFAASGVAVYALLVGPAPRLDRRWSVLLLVAGLALGGFWYARNLVLKGHPLYPVYGSDISSDLRVDPSEKFDSLRRTLEDLPGRMKDRFPYSAHAPDATSWGWFVLPWGIPLALIALRSDPRFRQLALGFIVGWFATLALSHYNQLNLRFALWFPAIFALAAGRNPGRWIPRAALVACALNFASTILPIERGSVEPFRVPVLIPHEEPIACLFGDDAPSYLYYNSDFSRRVVYPQSMEELKATGVKWAMVRGAPSWVRMAEWKLVSGSLYEIR